MSPARHLTHRGTVERYSDAVARLKSPGDTVIVKRGVPRSIVMQCPEGCGETITLNLDRRSGPAWRCFERSGLMTIYPSVWRDSGCRAHFIVWNNEILWCGTRESDEANWSDREFIVAVKHLLPQAPDPHRHFEELALLLDAVPWEVLWACQILVRDGDATSSESGTKFGRSELRPDSDHLVDYKV